MIYCGKAGFGHIMRSFLLNSTTIRLKRPQNLSQTSIPSLQPPKSDKLLVIGFLPEFVSQICQISVKAVHEGRYLAFDA